MVTKSIFVTLFLAICLVLVSVETLEFAERTHHPIQHTIDLSLEPFLDLSLEPSLEPSVEPSIEPSIVPSYDPPPFAGPLTVVKKPENGDRPEMPEEKETLRNTPPTTSPKIDFLKSLNKGGPKFSEPIRKIISASLARQTGWTSSRSRVSTITETKLNESETSFTDALASLKPETGGENGLTEIEVLRSKLLKAEVFMFFRLSFNPKGEFAIEMNLDPTAGKGVGVSFPVEPIRLSSESIPSVYQTEAPLLF